jgi:hypothetical protein
MNQEFALKLGRKHCYYRQSNSVLMLVYYCMIELCYEISQELLKRQNARRHLY